MKPIARRAVLLGGVSVAGVTALSARSSVIAATGTVPYPFKVGIASGEPDASSVVLWTRLAPSPLNGDGQGGMANADVLVDWQVASDERFTNVVTQGTATARYASAHTVHVVASGLGSGAEYFYRFRAQGHISPVGRTRTTPAANATGNPLVMAFASCAHWENGYFTAYRRMAEDNPGLVLHLGDYIYEDVAAGDTRSLAGGEAVTLADYRRRYAQYKTDPDLQAAHAVAPWLVSIDDHEVENNWAGPYRWEQFVSPTLTQAEWDARRAAAFQAFYENMPLRPAQVNSGTSIPMYRRIQWGNLATFHMLDTRQYRDNQACNDDRKVCSAADDPLRTMTGNAQEDWLLAGFDNRIATWDFIGQQVPFARRWDASNAGYMDHWDGYSQSRARIQNGWVAENVPNPVVLTGDVHRNWANNLMANYDDENSAVIGTELVCTSITSGKDGSSSTAIPDGAYNPWLKYSSQRRGYVRTTIGTDKMTADFRVVDYVTERGAPVRTDKSFVIQAGQRGLQLP